jgi:hypothetical protein
MTRARAFVVCLVVALALLATVGGQPAHAATCGDYTDQATAQHARDTRDGDGDGIYCESLPCPCAKPGADSDGGGSKPIPPTGTNPAGCVRPNAVQNISFSKTKYPNIRRHFLDALRKGWPRTLVLHRVGADARRDRLLAPFPTHPGEDRDEYPPAVGRGNGTGLQRGINPTGWRADVEYVPSGENRSHGSTMGAKLRRLCDGTHFRYVFY